MSFEGRVAIVTGASRGVGRAIALAFARSGCHVVVAGRSTREHARLPGTIYSVAEEIASGAPAVRALPVRCDVREADQIEAMVSTCVEELGRADILVNNAGAAWWKPVVGTPAKRFDLVMDVNFRAAHVAARAVIPHMIDGGFGHIINLSPPVGRPEMVGGKCAYMVSKFGMTYLAVALAEELEGEPVAAHALWPVTVVESYASINFGLGTREQWRTPDILADAAVALAGRDPHASSGRAWLDEEVLRELCNVTDFGGYACVPGNEPMKIPW